MIDGRLGEEEVNQTICNYCTEVYFKSKLEQESSQVEDNDEYLCNFCH